MSTNTRRILLSCVVLAVAACVCFAAISVTGLGVFLFGSHPATAIATPTPIATSTPALVTNTQPSFQASPTSIALPTLPGPTLSADISQQMDEIQSQVESYRGLHASKPVLRGVMTSAQLRQKVISDFLKDYTPADASKDTKILNAFGLLPVNFDFLTFQEDFLSEEIAGYYDNTNKEMYVISDEGFQGLQRFNYAHEFTHVLQDQNFDIQGKLGYSDTKCKSNSEGCAAIQALMEGDATLSQEEWLFTFGTSLDQQQISQFSQTFKSPVYDSAPEYYKEDSMFPYNQGLEFVQTLYDQGGWQAVDNAYLNPPVSTEQILHPDLYPSDQPVSVALPDLGSTLGADWTKLDQDIVGEWYTYLILAANYDPADRLSTSTAKQAAAGWGGDSYAIYSDNKNNGLAMVVVWKWDTTNDASQFMNAFTQYGSDRWGKPTTSTLAAAQWQTSQSYVSISLSGGTTTWILAPDAPTADKISTALK